MPPKRKAAATAKSADDSTKMTDAVVSPVVEEQIAEEKPKKKTSKKATKTEVVEEIEAPVVEEQPKKKAKKAVEAEKPVEEIVQEKPKAKATKKTAKTEETAPVEPVIEEEQPKKKGKKTAVVEEPVVEAVEEKPKNKATKKAAPVEEAPVAEIVEEKSKKKGTKKAVQEAPVEEPVVAEKTETEKKKSTKGKRAVEQTSEPVVESTNAVVVADEAPSTESMVQKNLRTLKKTRVWMDVMAGPHSLGRMVIELYNDCPLAFENFRSLCTGEVKDPVTGTPLSYKNKAFHVLSKDYVMGGDMKMSGTSNMSIYGGPFPDEQAGLQRTHDEIGTVSLFSTKKNENDSKFLITIKPHLKHLDGQFVVIGKVVKGLRAAYALSLYGDDDGKPEALCRIANVGRYKKNKAVNAAALTSADDEAIMSDSEGEEEEEDAEEEQESTQTTQSHEKPKCPVCGSESKYSKRVLGKGSRWLCRNEDCKHGFWHEDDKISTKAAQQLLEQQKRAKAEAREAANAAKAAKMEAKRQRALERKKAFEARDKDQNRKELREAKANDAKTTPALQTRLKAARDVAGPHLLEVVQAEFKLVEEHRQRAEENRIKGNEDFKRYNKEMEEKRKEMALAKRTREEEEEEIAARKKARYGDKGPRRDKNRDRNVVADDAAVTTTKDKTRYRNRAEPPQAWVERQQAKTDGTAATSETAVVKTAQKETKKDGKSFKDGKKSFKDGKKSFKDGKKSFKDGKKDGKSFKDRKSSKEVKAPVADAEVEKKIATTYDSNWKKAVQAMKK